MAEIEPFSVVWTNPAVKDLDDLCDWIESDNPRAAERLVAQIKRRVEELNIVPRTGSVYLQLSMIEIRQIVVRPYRIFYQLSQKQSALQVLRVWRGSRLEPTPAELGLPIL